MKKLFALFALPLTCFGQVAYDVSLQQVNAGGTEFEEKLISPAASSLLGFASTKAVVNVTLGTNLTLTAGNVLNAAGGVASGQGTAGQVLVNGTSGSAQTGALTFTLAADVLNVNSITAATGQDFTLASLDGNNDVRTDPHGTGFTRFLTASGDGVNVSSTGLIMNGALVGTAFNPNIPGDTANGDLTGSNGLGLLGQIKQNYGGVTWDSGANIANVFYASGAANADGTTTVQGVRVWSEVTGANNSTNVVGLIGSGVNAGSGTATSASGAQGIVRVLSSGNITGGVGVGANALILGTGNITGSYISFYPAPPIYSSTGRITGDIYGLAMLDMNAGNAGNQPDEIYGVDIRDQTKGTGIAASYRGRMASGTGKYNAYFDGTAQNYLAGVTTIGSTAPATTEMLLAKQTTSASFATAQWNSATTGDNAFISFGTEGSYTARGSITYNRAGGLVAYNTTSDQRIKKDFSQATDAPEIDNIRVGPYTLIETDTRVAYGVLAQELYQAYPQAVTPGDSAPLQTRAWLDRKARTGARNERNILRARQHQDAENAYDVATSRLQSRLQAREEAIAKENREAEAEKDAAIAEGRTPIATPPKSIQTDSEATTLRTQLASLIKPIAPTFEHDPEDDLPDPKLWAVDYSKLVPPLIAYAQASRREIRAQAERIAALEKRLSELEERLAAK